ncbi:MULTISPECIES: indolepyruvate ferredoxin oxidoreductase family protein [unclassified Sphingobium]|uniref:indolepyruvate ferredoxin oxidoreductase family protein n=1 Tax=unclassified Sphingobium TaxID=2611147 RepID=UPI00159BF195|nr:MULTISPECIES: indolepyruvate ferredoxin oxidoreductase family protein [unclassified Sphingobium]MCB4859784.1 indolepyruvate ferredoxin oxidoreductase family protein [Sphingobium sp. PNB]
MRDVKLDDKYTVDDGRVIMSGTHALIRVPLLQREIDQRNGLNTGGFISGYRGSPLGSYDMELWRAKKLLESHDILFQPGVNEDLAATAVWGTQMLATTPGANKDGVFAIWYGKGPGVDRSGDPFKHGNFAGTHPNGGVLIVAGDDHSGKSSTVSHQSEMALMHAGMPILAPSNVQDVIDLGLLGIAMSRYTGLYTGFKLTNETLEQTMTVDVRVGDNGPVTPDRGPAPANGFHNYPTHLDRIASETVVKRYRWPLIEKFVRANRIDRLLVDAPVRKLGIVSTGKAVQDVRQALKLLGLDDADAAAHGISVYKLGCMYPVERQGLAEFAKGQSELLFIEEKDPLTENQAKAILYGGPDMPRIVGKLDEDGVFMIPSDEQLEPVQLALVIAERLRRLGVGDAALAERAQRLSRQMATVAALKPADAARSPYFCSGCPHNTGTRFPEGSIAAGGIGCHAMAMYSGPEMMPNAQMGGEGAHWYSLAYFSDMNHIFQNMGDGTYYHSGLLAVRGAVAAKVNMTFKILFNDAVAMTGGQPVDGPLTPGDITRQVLAEGAGRCVVVTDRPDLYGAHSGLGEGVTVHHRDTYDAVQKQLRDVPGVTVIVYEQTCAAEKRRRRKRGKFPDPAKRMFINAAVCEGCGDCSVQSNCVSVWPKETELGRKRQIDQSNCNKDYSCVKGFCPSFVTVLDAEPRKPKKAQLDGEADMALPDPTIVPLHDGAYNIMISGIGGTGVVTIGALLAMAAHLEGKSTSVFDMTGLSQKNGAVFSHLRIAADNDDLGAQKLGIGEADLALAFDAVAGLAKEPAMTLSAERTKTVVNARITPTPAFQRNPDLTLDQGLLVHRLKALSVDLHGVDATGLGLALLGDTIAANLFMLGYACQLGLLPVSPQAIERAVEINGVAIPFNKAAFALGRLQAVDPARIEKAVVAHVQELDFTPLTSLEDIVAHRTQLLTDYQNAAWAQRYRDLVDIVVKAESIATPGKDGLSVMVARNFAKLMAYKDEYEVARLHADPAFKQQLKDAFEDGAKLRYNLAPPLFSKRDADGHLIKREFGPWMDKAFAFLARFKGLRGTAFDIFGYTQERKMERGLIDHYEAQMQMVAARLTPANHAAAVELASLPAQIRGYGHVKEANVEKVRVLEPMVVKKFEDAVILAAGAPAPLLQNA